MSPTAHRSRTTPAKSSGWIRATRRCRTAGRSVTADTSVLVTGGLGYLGGRLSLALAEDGACRLRLTTRRPPSARPSWSAAFDVRQIDLTDAERLDEACRGVDAVIHLAGTNERIAEERPAAALLETTLGTLELIRAAARQGVRRVIYMSTAHVYGAPLAGRLSESSVPRPLHPYAITHRAAEDFVLAAAARGQLEGVVLRLSNGLGAPADPLIDRWTLVGNDLCRQAAEHGELRLRSSGGPQRDFIPLADVCRAVQHVLRLPAPALGDGLFNLGGARTLSIQQLAELIADRAAATLGVRPRIRRPSPAAGEETRPLDYRMDKLERTGFTRTATLEDEIDRTLVVCREMKEHV